MVNGHIKIPSSSAITIKVELWNSYLQPSEVLKSYLMVSNQITWRTVRIALTAPESCAVLTLNSTAEKQIAVLLDLFCSKAERKSLQFLHDIGD